ncbi:MAG: hypothetical protein HDT42_04815 [Ruminococcaceae bacterium]|nr:hypothetical protein [Oscillospiraceae bacterium]
MNTEEKIELVAQVLDILAKHKCSLTDAQSIWFNVESTLKDSAVMCERDFREELRKKAYPDLSHVPPRKRPFCR